MNTIGQAVARRSSGILALIVRRPGWMCLIWAIVAAPLFLQAPELSNRLLPNSRLDVGEARQAGRVLASEFAGGGARQVVLVVSGVSAPDRAASAWVLLQVEAALKGNRWVTRIEDPLLTAGPAGAAPGNPPAGVVLTAVVSGRPAMGVLVRSLRSATPAIVARLRSRHPMAAAYWTGQLPLDHDLLESADRDVRRAELRALPLTFALVLCAFGALAAAFLPVGMAVLAIALALGSAATLGLFVPLSGLVQNVISLLGLALGIDYSLLVVSRYREESAANGATGEAVALALRRAGPAVAISGASVATGFAALMLVPLQELRSIAVGGLAVTAFSVLLATTLLPALLALIGHRVDFGALRKRPAGPRPADRWRRLASWIVARPVLALLVAGVPLIVLAANARHMPVGFPNQTWLPRGAGSTKAIVAMEAMGRGGLVYRIQVLLKLPDGARALEMAGWLALKRLHTRLLNDRRIERVVSLPGLVGLDAPLIALRSELPRTVKERYLSRDASWALFEVIPRRSLKPQAMMRLAADLRGIEVEAISGGSDGRLLVGGLPAATLDYQQTILDALPMIFVVVIGGTFVTLMIGFRSIVIPLKAVLLNLLTVIASFGVLHLVFVQGYGCWLFGLSQPVSGVFPAVPVMVFCTMFGISMDYEVFLTSRIAESRRAGEDEAGAIVAGVTQTAGIITSAAAIMVAVFGAFAFGSLLPVQMMGVALAVAVLLDATLVRLALAPALFRLGGRWNWWPGKPGLARPS
jgi:RND superfamily putative drug exporter